VAALTSRLIGMNHVALEVGDLDEALAFYRRLFSFELRGRVRGMAFLDLGDQFIALAEGRTQGPDDHRHVGLVVDDREPALAAAREAGADVRGHDIVDPWGNRLQLVEYADVQFTKAPEVMSAMRIQIEKSERAKAELRAKGIEPEPAG
jgi:catechol 2,3-dioxygenase-like lactoylglutathione lyase family enzyme